MPPRTCTCISPKPRSSAIAWAASMTSRDDRRMPALRDLSSARARTSRPRLSSAAPPVISPQTVQLYDFGRSIDGRVFLAMELIEAVDLQRLVSA